MSDYKGLSRLPYERRQQILNRIKDAECAKIEDLAEEFNVSTMTIYRDVQELIRTGEATRVYGGVKASEDDRKYPELIRPYTDNSIEERFNIQLAEKNAIARAAAEFVKDGDIIAIDPSTTTLHMCTYLQDKNIIVVTTSISVALQFASSDTVSVILCGGKLRKNALSVVGSLLQETLNRLNISKSFISSRAFDINKGLTDATLEETDAKIQVIKRTEELFILVDHTKIGKVAPFHICDASDAHCIITDDAALNNPEVSSALEELEKLPINVVCAKVE